MSKQEEYMADLNRREKELHDRAKEIRERLDGIRETVERRENELAAEVKTTLPKEAYDYAADLKRREEELHERAKEAAARLEGIRETVERRENELDSKVKEALPKEAYDHAADLKRRTEEVFDREKDSAQRLEEIQEDVSRQEAEQK